MSIVKDFLLISFFLVMVINCLRLHRKLIGLRRFFIETLSHDLRISAIAQIRGIELLKKDENKNELIEYLSESCNFSLEMINMLLNTFRYENGEEILKYESFNISETISNCCNKLFNKALEKGIIFSYAKNFNNPTLFAEKNEIQKVINTLLCTAIYNSYKNNVIKIDSNFYNNTLEINIIYKGKKLTKEECKELFSKHQRFSVVGQGIKMHLIKKIIDFHHGKIYGKNIDEDTICFTILLPNKDGKNRVKTPVLSSLQAYNS